MAKVRYWLAGPRSWEAPEPVSKVLKVLIANHGIGSLLLITGGAPGLDKMVEDLAREEGVHVFACRANWPIGRQAGPLRNRVIAQEFAPRALIAFHYYPLEGTNHKGTRSAITEAKRAGIPVKKIKVAPHVAMPSSVGDDSPLGNRARIEQGLPPKTPKAVQRRAKRAGKA